MESRAPKGNIDEWIRSHDQDQYLGTTGNVVVDEASSRGLVHAGVYFAIDFLQQEAFEDIEADGEVENEDNADNEGAERCKNGDRLERYAINVRAFLYIGAEGHVGVEIPGGNCIFHDRISLRYVEQTVRRRQK